MLEIRDLRVDIGGHEIVHIDELDLPRGTRLGLVGESGSGKTLTAKAIAGLLPDEAKASGTVRFDGRNLIGLDDGEFSEIRGKRIGFIFQDPARSLNPMMRVGRQVSEAIRLHTKMKGRAVTDKVAELLEQVHLPDPGNLLSRYPHQLSGGQQQRVMIAAAIAADPELLIADEPTTALDVTVQHEILRLLISLSDQREMSVLFVSHDLGVVRYVCDRVAVVYGGEIVETGRIDDLIHHPRHRYTTALLGANPGLPKDDDFGSSIGMRLRTIEGSVPPVGRFPSGCRFRNRCAYEIASCAEVPPLVTNGDGHRSRCWNPAEES
jgi:peptide/nickel transport system ATP-binding protein